MNHLKKKELKKIKLKYTDYLYKVGAKKIKINFFEPRILLYHGVTADARSDINARFISTELFEKQLKYFKSHFNIVPLCQLNEANESDKKPRIALSFDDGYENNFKEVLPILEKYEAPATIFITAIQVAKYDFLWADLLDLHRLRGPSEFKFEGLTYKRKKHEFTSQTETLKSVLKASNWSTKEKFISRILKSNQFIEDKNLFPYFKLLSPQQIKGLSKSNYIELGSHGVYHNCLDMITEEEAIIEMQKSKDYLEQIIGKEVALFAYPDGRYNNKLIELAEKVGYKKQYVVDYNKPEDRKDNRIQNRFGINPYISFNNQIQAIINGKY